MGKCQGSMCNTAEGRTIESELEVRISSTN